MRPFFISSLLFLVILPLVACQRGDASAKNGESKSMLDQVKDGANIDQSSENTSEDEVPTADVSSIEIILAERGSTSSEAPDVLVYVILYDKDQNMVSSAGNLDLAYALPDAEAKKKKIKLIPSRFREQVIPGEGETTLSFLADILHAPPPGSIVVQAKFDGRVEAESSLDDDPEADSAAE